MIKSILLSGLGWGALFWALGFRAIYWLKHGNNPEVSLWNAGKWIDQRHAVVWDGSEYPGEGMDWVGFEKIFTFIMNCPAEVVPILFIVLVAY